MSIRAALPAALASLAILASAQAAATIGPGVIESASQSGMVRVMIFLEVPEAVASSSKEARAAVAAAQEEVLALLGGDFTLQRRFKAIPALAGDITASGAARLAGAAGVVRVDLDEGGSAGMIQSLPLANVDDMHARGYGGLGATVAVLDTGINAAHADLSDSLDGEACFCSASGAGCCPNGDVTQLGAGAAADDNGHGTNVIGIVVSNGTVAPRGVARDARVVAIKVLDFNSSFCCSSDVVAGLDWIITDRPDVDVVNMSLGTSALFTGACDNVNAFTQAYAAAVNTLRSNGVITFVSSGNNGSGTTMNAPACVANSVSVGAVWDSNLGPRTFLGCTDASTAADQVTCFSNSNSTTDLFAPGAFITSAGIGGGTSSFGGTSQAAPHAAGCAALMVGAAPGITPASIEAAMESFGPNVTDVTNGLSFRRLDCFAAFNFLCTDDDLDGFGQAGHTLCGGSFTTSDCDDANGDVWTTPGEVPSLDIMADQRTLVWTQPAQLGGTLVAYDLLASDSDDFVAAAQCAESNEFDLTASYVPKPLPGFVVYLLARGSNDCPLPGGEGSLGTSSSGAARPGRTCP